MSSYTKIKEPVYATCSKCGDQFKLDYGGKSCRRPCRYHIYENGSCTDCGKHKNSTGGNCYHIRSRHFLGIECCTIS